MKSTVPIILFLFIIQVGFYLFTPTDSTDEGRWDRSGLTVYTDSKTGVQYVKGGLCGGLQVRIDSEGKPLIKEK